ncbi:MAG: Mur ligase family protein, partial [Burkholderiales bacterium]
MFSKNSKVNWITFTQLIDQLGNLLPKCNLTTDSRQVRPGGIFCAYPGTATDGRQFIPAATQAGAGFILWEAGINFNYPIPNQEVANLIAYVGLIAAEKYAKPSSRIKVIGVTGTNGKTSVTHWLNQAYSQVGQKTAIIGTTGAGVYPAVADYAATTPDPITLQRLLAEFVVASVKVVAMEVSSHAMHQGRVNGTNFATAIFTNLTQDHLDYHLTLENYYQTKRELFYWQGLKQAVINSDDTYGSRLHQEILEDKLPVKVISYGIISGDLRASEIKINLSGMSFVLSYLNKSCLVGVKVVGKFNVYNLLAVAGAMLLDGYTLDQIAT